MVRSLIAIGLVFACIVVAAEPPTLEPTSSRTNFFAGQEATLGTLIRGRNAVAGRLAWTLTAFGRTLAGATHDVRHDGGSATAADVTFVAPEVRDGVIVEAAFTAVLVDAAGARLATHTRPVRFFPAAVFAGRMRWLDSLRIVVVDPIGDTQRALAAVGLPFTPARSEADIAAAEPRMIVVGEGISWLDRPDLPAVVTRFAARGVPVLCLAPRDGTLPLPGVTDVESRAVAERFAFERAGIVVAIDPRLDGRDWVAQGQAISSRLAVVAEGDRALIRITAAAENPAGWPWLEIDYADLVASATPGTLVVCGFGIVVHWDETPAARYLFAALLDRLTANPPHDRLDSSPTDARPEKPR